MFDAQGLPVNGVYDMTFRLYAEGTAGDLLFEESFVAAEAVQIENGYFWVLLANNQASTLTLDEVVALHDQLYLELEVAGSILEPRQALAPVPWALSSGFAANTGGGGTHSDRDTLGNLACADGQIPKRVAGVWGCADDDTGSASSGVSWLSISGIPAGLVELPHSPTLACPPNGSPTWTGTAWSCATDPKVGTLTPGRWCTTDGSVIVCDQAAPTDTNAATLCAPNEYLDGDGTCKSTNAHTHNYAAAGHTHNYAAASHGHSYASLTHTHSYASVTHGHALSCTDESVQATVAAFTSHAMGVECRSGYTMTGGGCRLESSNAGTVHRSYNWGNGWWCSMGNGEGVARTMTLFARCCRIF